MIGGAGPIKLQAQSRFFRSMGAMLSAGMPMVGCLRSEEGKSVGRVGAVAHQLRLRVEGGATLSESMGALSGTFDVVVVGMIRAAESSGRLSETMGRIADMQEAKARLRKRIRSATAYPAVVLCLALAVSWFLASFILPILAGLLDGRTAPLPTRLVMSCGAWIRTWGVFVLAGLVALTIPAMLVGRTRKGARALQGCLLWIPVVGGMARKVAVARFARVYGSLVQSGVSVLRALELSAGAAGNGPIEDAIMRARKAVESGESLSSAMAREKVIPSELVEMLRSGEKSGRVDEMLDAVAVYYEQDVEAILNTLPALIQPVLIILLGIIVLVIALSVFMPLWSMVDIPG